MKCQEVKDRLKKWGNRLTKNIRKQMNNNSMKFNHEVWSMCLIIFIISLIILTQVKVADSPHDFMTSPVIAEHVNELIAVTKTRPLIWREIRVVLVYLAAHLIFLNGHRPGVVQRMTINEWEMRVVEDDHWVIDVMDHKTSGAF